MTAYAFFEVRLKAGASEADRAAYDRYRVAVPPLVEQHGGRYLARAWNGTALEGSPPGDRFHLIEFPDAEAARAFWASPDYRAISLQRGGAADVRALLIEPA